VWYTAAFVVHPDPLNTGQHTTVLAVRMTTWLQTKRRGRRFKSGRPTRPFPVGR